MNWTLPLALSLVENPRRNGTADSWKAHCPAHEDNTPSLSLSRGNQQELVLRCHAGCEYSAIIVELTKRLKKQATTYVYQNRAGQPIGRVQRTYDAQGKKTFYQSIPNGSTWKRGSSDELKTTPYKLPRILRAIERKQPIFIVEGEKDAERLIAEGRAATCNVGGVAMGWKDAHSQWLTNATRIFIIADNDEPGIKHAWAVYDSLLASESTAKITVVISPFGKDITEHLDLGYSLKELTPLERDLMEEVAPDYGFVSFASFIFDSPAEVPAIWGENGKVVLWAEGQGLTIMAPQAIGKTTLAILLTEARLGLTDSVLDFPVKKTEKGVLYLAMDRPTQIGLAMRRRYEQYGRENPSIQIEWAILKKGPPEKDLARNPDYLLELSLAADADTVFVDSLKDGVIGLIDDKQGQGWNLAVQRCIAGGVQVCVLHHLPKYRSQEGRSLEIDDSYGSGWLTAGMGSVLSLNGKPDSIFCEFSQNKPPAQQMDTLTLRRDDRTGMMTRMGTILDWAWFFMEPRTIKELQKEMFPGEDSKINYNRAKRQVEDLLEREIITQHSQTLPGKGQGRAATRYVLRTPD